MNTDVMILRRFGAVVCVVAVCSCATPQGEAACTAANRKVTIGSLLSNTLSGSYDACLNELRRDLAALHLEGRLLEAEAQRLSAEAEAAEAERQTALQRVADLLLEQAALAQQLAELDEDVTTSQAELESILAGEQALRERLSALDVSVTDDEMRAEIERLEAEQQQILAVIEALTAE